MRVGPFGLTELLIILAIILLVFGAKRLPEIGSSLGRGIRTFKSAVTGEEEKEEPSETASVTKRVDEPSTSGTPAERAGFEIIT
jgi:sec-independent protein translocase protein TatA